MGKDKFVRGTARKQVARPEPPHEDRRTKRNRTRQATAAGAIDESAESSEELATPEFGPWDD